MDTMANMEIIQIKADNNIKVATQIIMSIIKIMPESLTTRQLRLQCTLLKTKSMPIMEEAPLRPFSALEYLSLPADCLSTSE